MASARSRWHHREMVRWRWWRGIPEPGTCSCGERLEARVVGAAQRWGAEPVSSVWCWHCRRCGDVRR